jgi:hypothetical protein
LCCAACRDYECVRMRPEQRGLSLCPWVCLCACVCACVCVCVCVCVMMTVDRLQAHGMLLCASGIVRALAALW